MSDSSTEDDDELDGCDIDFKVGPQATNEEAELMPLFADALDPNTSKTVDEAAEEWRQLGLSHGDS